MAIRLQKGQKINLNKDGYGLSKILIGLGWDAKTEEKGFFSMFFSKGNIDCDASAILLKNDKLNSNSDVVYFGNLKHLSNTVWHTGDNLTGEGEGDDEQIILDLNSIPKDYNKIVIVANIYKAFQRHQHFGMIENAFIRIVNLENNREICRYNLTDNYNQKTAIIFGAVYRRGEEWKFDAIGEGTKDEGLNSLIKRYK